ncbi:hypothetical protein D9758_015406 [Tetrapyrgos nigripes]|uniref:GTP cyclohydrolase N-terminal domain-containing protein n=1 Tax=Tetrapyrgos nigripes TaxID=182062 RepID=A0A8H5CJI2_9AGAR|nr:hypothetical protein D9758_015406 [Tetrapyrgos nigripes]
MTTSHQRIMIFANQLLAKEERGEELDIRPSIGVTRAHSIKLSELDEAVRRGEIDVDGKIVMKNRPAKREDGSESESESESIDPGGEVAVSKAAVEPVWYSPGAPGRFGISETLLRLRCSLFEQTGRRTYHAPRHQNLTSPIGNFTVYIFGDPPSPPLHPTYTSLPKSTMNAMSLMSLGMISVHANRIWCM